ncbi:ABC-three component system protein [Azotobacter chroococcum]|uniref:ABC-three component system protein n=1 Tax=Azotobacter chroococcum TaxID=353 RepID=UPI0013F154F5|nr:ABC-three component system protein [Azotobacter chroococcum]
MNVHAVKVNSGSGVLISALSQEYSYVLTAAHVVRDSQDQTILNHKGEQINDIQTYFHPDANVDCAVIKIPYDESINLSLCLGEPPHQAPLMMVGYPGSRAKETAFHKKVKQQDAALTSWVNGEIVISATGAPDKEMIDGFSGAGVYYLDDGYPRLIAIEFSMDGAKVEEYFGRIKCHAIRWYEELVESHSLAPIMPSFLECFSILKDKTFNYDIPGAALIDHIKEELGGIIDEILEDESTKPSLILKKYETGLLFSGEHQSSLLDIRLWISYLEFMAISVLLDNPTKADSSYFSGLDTKRRLVFSKSEKNWIGELRSLLELAGTMLDEGGSLIIDNCEAVPTAMPASFQIQGVLAHIARPRSAGSRLKINQVSKEKYTTFRLAHIRALHRRCVVEHIEDFYKKDSSEYIDMLRGFYNVYVN